jgi:hypothetical protein
MRAASIPPKDLLKDPLPNTNNVKFQHDFQRGEMIAHTDTIQFSPEDLPQRVVQMLLSMLFTENPPFKVQPLEERTMMAKTMGSGVVFQPNSSFMPQLKYFCS